jgi:FixJ family two-component response regulator
MLVWAARIAIVDDDASVRRALRRLLKVSAYEPRAYDSAPNFIRSLAPPIPDCLVADWQMPGMTGLELHNHLVSAGIAIPTIIITAHDDADIRRRCTAAGVKAFLLKPLARMDFLSAIDDAIGRR